MRFITVCLLLFCVVLAAAEDRIQESGGLVVFDVESQSAPSPWESRTNISGYLGSSFFYPTGGSTTNPGTGTISYPITVNSSGQYQLQWRSRIAKGSDSTEHNDTWARLLNSSGNAVTPVSNNNVVTKGWYKVYHNTTNAWSWQSSNKDKDPKSLSWDLAPGDYTFEISARSDGHAVDRVVLFDRDRHN